MLIHVDDSVELRLLEQRYAPALFALIDQNRAGLRAWLSWLDRHTSVRHTHAFIREVRRQADRSEAYHFGIWEADRLVGVIGLHYVDWNDRTTSIGYWLDRGCRGRGLLTRSCTALLDHVFFEFRLNRVEIRCAVGNAKSRAIPERLGFTQEGTLRQAQWLYDHFVDHALYAVLAQTWRARRASAGSFSERS